jgi:glycosyltransferase involved in cell wall biosynthesis
MTISVVVCAYNEGTLLPACLYSLLSQTRLPDEILVVNNASTDATGTVARAVPHVRVLDEPVKGLVVARETGRRAARGDVLAYIDADCRVPIFWLERIEQRLRRSRDTVALTGPYRFYDWDWSGRSLIRLYDWIVAPATHTVVHRALAIGAILYGGNFAVRADALARIGGFDQTIEFHGEDTNLGRRLTRIGAIQLSSGCWVWTSARRYRAVGKARVFSLYTRNFWSEILRHRPADREHLDVRAQ